MESLPKDEEGRRKRPRFEFGSSGPEQQDGGAEMERGARGRGMFADGGPMDFLAERRESGQIRKEGPFGSGNTFSFEPPGPSPFSQSTSPFAALAFNFQPRKAFPVPGDRDEESKSSGGDFEDGAE